MGGAVQFSGVIAMHEWSTLKKLIWLYAAKLKGGASAIIETITGNLPLVLQNAVQHSIKSLTRYGLCTQDGTPTPSAPVDIMCNNGPLRYGALGRNLLDPSAANTVLEFYINKADGEVKPSPPNFMFAGYMPVEAGKTYVAYGRAKTGNDLSDYNRVAWYDSSKNWISGADYTQNRIAVVTAPANAAYARFSCNPSGTSTTTVTQEIVDSYNWMFAEGTAEITPFVPFDGGIYPDGTPEVLTVSADGAETQTVTDIPMLLSVGDTKDEVEIISGGVTHRVGIKVFDGTESFGKSSAYGAAFYIQSAANVWGAKKEIVMCSHYLGLAAASSAAAEDTCFFNASGHFYFRVADNSDTAAFKADLAAKYASGNPVILLYPLATETTEQATPQALSANEGTNIVDSVANVSPLEAEVKYMAASAQDVLSTLLGMRVTPKDISTQDAENMINIITGEENK